jgi:putative ABC transport system permease protein
MFKFILKGLLRDRSRSIFPLLVVVVGVLLTVYFTAFLNGFVESMIRQNANLDTGHLKVVSRAYAEAISQKPTDLALLEISDDLETWKRAYPQLDWAPRISFGALLDVPDSSGLTLQQGEVAGMAIDLFSNEKERRRLRLDDALRKGRLPAHPGEILVSNVLYDKLKLKPGQRLTLIGSTVFGAMALKDFRVTGSVEFGVQALDRGGVIADISDIRQMLDLGDGASEILGFFTSGDYNDRTARALALQFNQTYSDSTDEFSPQMLTLTQQNDLGGMLAIMGSSMSITIAVFILLMSIILWNSGLLNGIRRYGEFGVRLAMGEQKGHIYRWLVIEAAVIGLIGTVIGTGLGLLISWYLQTHGFDFSAYTTNSTLLYENVIYAHITPICYVIGLIPGLLAIVAGAMLAGISIYKRQTSQLFKELEA